MIKKLYISLIVTGILLSCSNGYAMDDGKGKTVPVNHHLKSTFYTEHAKPFFKGWGPTLALATGVAVYTALYDRQVPCKVLGWLKSNVLCKPKLSSKFLVTIPATFFGGAVLYEYYKKRVPALYALIRP